MANSKPKLVSKEQLAEKKNTVDLASESDLVPPVPGAFLYTCEGGPNAGCKYWAIKKVDEKGVFTSKFVDWVGKPNVNIRERLAEVTKENKSLKQQIDEHLEKGEKLKAKLRAYKVKLAKFKTEDSMDDSE